MSITAFPVPACLLTERQIQHTRLGVLALTCSVVDNVIAWCLLAVVIVSVHAKLASQKRLGWSLHLTLRRLRRIR